MRVAAIYDIHANLPALEAVLGEIRTLAVDRIVVGGDVLPGPMPVESLELLAKLGTPASFILGNGDREVLALMNGIETEWYRSALESWREPVRWTAEQLGPEHALLIESWSRSCRFDIAGLGGVHFCHATPRNDTDCFTRETPEDVLLPLFAGVEDPVVICGHTHMQFDRPIGPARVVNAGSVGMPFGEPGACWLLLDEDVQLRRTSYDLDAASARVRRTQYTQIEAFVAHCLLDPPPELQMIELYAGYDLSVRA